MNQSELNSLNDIVCERIDEVFAHLSVNMIRQGKMYMGVCPIHGGDNPTGLNFYPYGYKVNGFWRCNTHHCEESFVKNGIGLIRAILSRQKCEWSQPGHPTFSFAKTIAFLCDVLKIKVTNTINESVYNISKSLSIDADIHGLRQKMKPNDSIELPTRSEVRARLKIPAEQFVQRGFSPKIIDHYDIGVCLAKDKPMTDRIVVPVYNQSLRMVGCLGRSIYPKCEQCSAYHDGKMCPEQKQWFTKWKNSYGFLTGHYLYNLWYAQSNIDKTKCIILTEGAGDVLKLEDADIHNSVALFGSAFTEQQEILLETTGALSLIIATDMDEAGRLAAQKIKNRCGKHYNIIVPELPKKDIGDMSIDEVKQLVVPILEKATVHL